MLKRIRMRARREWVQSFGMIAATTALAGSASSTSRAVVVSDAVMDWNQIALAATVTAGQGAIPQVRSMTIVQVAVNDAVNGITGEHGTYCLTALRRQAHRRKQQPLPRPIVHSLRFSQRTTRS